MARIDPNIILQLRQPQMADPLEMQQKAMSLKMAGMQLDQAQRENDYTKTLGELYRTSTDQTGKVDQAKLMQGMAQAGMGARIPGLQKQFADADKARADLGKVTADTAESNQKTESAKFKLMRDRQEATNGMLSSLLARPVVSHQDVINGIGDIVQRGYATPEEGAAIVRALPGHPAKLREFLLQKGIEGLEASKRFDALAPKFEKVDVGGSVQTGTVNPLTGQFTKGAAMVKTASPEARLTDARERQLASQGVTYQTDENGNIVALPSRLAPGQAPSARPVLDAQGKPMVGKSALTEDQGKASGWLSQARNAYSNVLQALADNPDALRPGAGDAVGMLPFMGAAGRMLQSPERQKFNQATSSMAEAFLRAATGAGVNKDEAKQKITELTPQFGDDDALIQQKLEAIPVYLRSLEMRAGAGAKRVPEVATPTTPTDTSGVPPDILKILKKHGGKGAN